MGNVDPGSILDGGGADFMSAAIKYELCAAGAPLAVIGASPKGSNKYGDFVGFTVKVGGGGERRGEEFLIALSWNEVRERQAKAFLGLLSDANVTSVGPVYLSQIETKSGQVAWILQKVPHEGAVVENEGSDNAGAVRPTAAVPADDDIPF
jgi:hypothetical protein